jgi:hypothetical protein
MALVCILCDKPGGDIRLWQLPEATADGIEAPLHSVPMPVHLSCYESYKQDEELKCAELAREKGE